MLVDSLRRVMLFQVAATLEIDITPLGCDYQLLPFVIGLARAPLPPHWHPVATDSLAKNESSAPEGSASASDAGVDHSKDVFEHELTNARCVGHPGAPLVMPTVRGMQIRARRSLKPLPTDGWVEFCDDSGQPYFYNFRGEIRCDRFPALGTNDVMPCVLPPRQLEPSAQHLVESGMATFPPDMSYREAVAMAHALVYEPRKVARAVHLASNPCPIDELLMNAQLLGISPVVSCAYRVAIQAD